MSVKTEVDKWIADKCNERLIANYPLDENSWVIDLGGYFGAATQKVVSKYNCNVLVIEPVEDFYNIIIEKFKDNSKVIVENNGISTEEKEVVLDYNYDGTSSYTNTSEIKINVKCYPIDYYLKKYNIDRIDLLMVNIEGEEFPLFEKWIKTDFLNKVNYLEIQFHPWIDDSVERKNKIENGFVNLGFENLWDYQFAFTSWKNKNY